MDNNKDNSNIKDDIINKVQSAIDSKDFSGLNKDISETVNKALEELRYQLRYKPVNKQPADNVSDATNLGDLKSDVISQNSANSSTPSSAAPQSNVHIGFMSSQTIAYKPPVNKVSSSAVKPATKATPATGTGTQTPMVIVPARHVGKYKGPFYQTLGITGTALTSVGVLVMMALSSALPSIAAIPAVGGSLLISLPIWIFVACRGSSIRKRYVRFQSYLTRLSRQGFASISELARSVGRTERYVINDLQKMLSLGMFPEGHFDENYTCFIANDPSYRQYRTAQNSYNERVREGTVDTVIDESKKENDRVNAVIKQGNEYIAKIRQINDELPDEEISAKLDILETTIDKIFQHIDSHPEQLSELDKFMQYYLPTTIKLLTVYHDFDMQPIQGENIGTAKKEILGTLDTINHAFIKLFDSLFQTTAWDVSTDISVLETMLAREGLTQSAFEMKGDK